VTEAGKYVKIKCKKQLSHYPLAVIQIVLHSQSLMQIKRNVASYPAQGSLQQVIKFF